MPDLPVFTATVVSFIQFRTWGTFLFKPVCCFFTEGPFTTMAPLSSGFLHWCLWSNQSWIKTDIITAPNMSSVCNTSRPQLCVVDSMVMNNGMRAVLSPTEYSTAEQIQMWLTSFLGRSGQMYYVNAPSRAQLGNFHWCHWPQCLHVVTCVKV